MARYFIFLWFFPLLTSANVWDNLFDGEGVPFELPFNFTALISPMDAQDHFKYHFISSTLYNALSINITASINSTEIGKLKFDFNEGRLYVYSPAKGCLTSSFHELKFDFYYRLEGLVELALLMNSRDNVGSYKKVGLAPEILALNISSCLKDVAFYFLGDNVLKLMEIEFTNKTKSTFIVETMEQQDNIPMEEFLPNPEWQCEEKYVVKIEGEYYVVDENGNKERLIKVILDFLRPRHDDIRSIQGINISNIEVSLDFWRDLFCCSKSQTSKDLVQQVFESL